MNQLGSNQPSSLQTRSPRHAMVRIIIIKYILFLRILVLCCCCTDRPSVGAPNYGVMV